MRSDCAVVPFVTAPRRRLLVTQIDFRTKLNGYRELEPLDGQTGEQVVAHRRGQWSAQVRGVHGLHRRRYQRR